MNLDYAMQVAERPGDRSFMMICEAMRTLKLELSRMCEDNYNTTDLAYKKMTVTIAIGALACEMKKRISTLERPGPMDETLNMNVNPESKAAAMNQSDKLRKAVERVREAERAEQEARAQLDKACRKQREADAELFRVMKALGKNLVVSGDRQYRIDQEQLVAQPFDGVVVPAIVL